MNNTAISEIMRDLRIDDLNLKRIPLKQIRKDMQDKAYSNALREHRVSHFVKNLPFDSTTSYPAIMYLTVANEKFTNDRGQTAGNSKNESKMLGKSRDDFNDDSKDTYIIQNSEIVPSREAEETTAPRERYLTKGQRSFRKLSDRQVREFVERNSKKDDPNDHDPNSDNVSESDTSWYYTSEEAISEISRTVNEYNRIVSRPDDRIPTDFISWGIPAHDHKRQKERGCGFYHANDGTTIYSACPTDHHHHIKAKAMHCWSLACPKCMNDTALKKGVEVEQGRDEDIRQNTIWSRKYYLAALTDATKVVKITLS